MLSETFFCPKCKDIFCADEVKHQSCPKCSQPLEAYVSVHLWSMSGQLVGKNVSCKTFISGESLPKATYVKFEAYCVKCGQKRDVNFAANKKIRRILYEALISHETLNKKDVKRVLPTTGCVIPEGEIEGRHAWSIKRLEPPLDYRHATLRDDVSFQEAVDKSVIARSYPAIIFGKPSETQRITALGEIVVNPKTAELTFIVTDSVSSTPLEDMVLTDEDINVLSDTFKDKTLDELLTLCEPMIAPEINGRAEAKLASLLTTCSSLWFNISGGKRVSGVIKTLFTGDKRCGKGSILRWWKEAVGIGEHGIGESASRAGLSYYVDTESNTIIWGLLPQADMGLALIEAIHGLPSEQMIEFREILVSGRVEVRKKVSASRWARTRIIADANPPRSLSSYVFPCLAIPSLRCFTDPIDITRWDTFVPFGEYDVPTEEIVKTRKAENEHFIEALRKLVRWIWTRKMDQIKITDKAVEKAEEIAKKLMDEYRFEHVPIVHNATLFQLLRIACAFAGATFNTEDYETLNVDVKQVEMAHEFITMLLDLWEVQECREVAKKKPLTEEKFMEIKEYLDSSDTAMEALDVIAVRPLNSVAIAGQIGKNPAYVRKIMSEMKALGIVDTRRGGYELTTLGIQAYKRIKKIEEKMEKVEKIEEWPYGREDAT